MRSSKHINWLHRHHFRIIDGWSNTGAVQRLFLWVTDLLVERLDVCGYILSAFWFENVVVLGIWVCWVDGKELVWSAVNPNFYWNLALAAATLSGSFSSPLLRQPPLFSLNIGSYTSWWGRCWWKPPGRGHRSSWFAWGWVFSSGHSDENAHRGFYSRDPISFGQDRGERFRARGNDRKEPCLGDAHAFGWKDGTSNPWIAIVVPESIDQLTHYQLYYKNYWFWTAAIE